MVVDIIYLSIQEMDYIHGKTPITLAMLWALGRGIRHMFITVELPFQRTRRRVAKAGGDGKSRKFHNTNIIQGAMVSAIDKDDGSKMPRQAPTTSSPL
ncbi:unnamed protein product [Brassica oleracea]